MCVCLWESPKRVVCSEPVGPCFSRLRLRAAGAVWLSCGVRVRSWNHPNPLPQLQHLLAHHNQSEGRAQSRDKSACSVIFSRDPGGGVRTKDNPRHLKTLLLYPPSSSSPRPSGFDILDSCMEEKPSLFILSHTPHVHTNTSLGHDRKMTLVEVS